MGIVARCVTWLYRVRNIRSCNTTLTRERERERERPRFRRELQISERNFVTLVRTDTSGIEISVTPDDEDSCILLGS